MIELVSKIGELNDRTRIPVITVEDCPSTGCDTTKSRVTDGANKE